MRFTIPRGFNNEPEEIVQVIEQPLLFHRFKMLQYLLTQFVNQISVVLTEVGNFVFVRAVMRQTHA